MTERKVTKLTVREDSAVKLASQDTGSNLNITAFNIDYIATRNPKLVQEVYKLYKKVQKVEKLPPTHKFRERFF